MPDARVSNTITGRDAFLRVLSDEGVVKMFGNPGTTELPIMHALSSAPEMGYVLALQEAIVIAMADGYARASGKLVSCNVHVAPGLGNAIGSIYTSLMSGTPMIVTAGQQEQGHGLTEPLLYAPLMPIATPVVKWATEVNRIEDLPRILRRAAKVATTAPTGPVFISLPGDILNNEAAIDLGATTRVDTAVRPSDAALEQLARRLLAAKKSVILAGHEIATSDAFAEAARPGRDPGRAGAAADGGATARTSRRSIPAFVGVAQPRPEIRAPRALRVRPDVLRRFGRAQDVGVERGRAAARDHQGGDDRPARLGDGQELPGRDRAARRRQGDPEGAGPAPEEAGRRDARRHAPRRRWPRSRRATGPRSAPLARPSSSRRRAEKPLPAEWLMMRLSEGLPKDAIIVDEGLTSAGSLMTYFPFRDRNSFFGNVSGGIGWGIAAAVGVQIAEPTRRVVAVIGDGSAMYSIQALWTAANQKLPMIFLICNNGGYQILKNRLKLFHGNDKPIGMDFNDPPIDVASARQGLRRVGRDGSTRWPASTRRWPSRWPRQTDRP